MSVDLSKLDAANKAIQSDKNAAKTTKAYAQAATDVLHAMNPTPTPPSPPPPPPGGIRWGISSNIAGWPSREEPRMVALGAKLTREDTAGAFAWCQSNGVSPFQIIDVGGTAAADSRAYGFNAGGNEPYWNGVNPPTYFPAVLADVKALKAKFPGIPVSCSVVSRGLPGSGNGGSFDANGNYTYGGVTKPWTSWIHDLAPELLTLVDAWEAHPYFDHTFKALSTVRNQLTGYGVAQPFWCTEIGMYLCTSGGEVGTKTPGQQATDFQTIITNLGARTDVTAVVFYRLSENTEGTEQWGVLDANGNQLPAWSIVKAVM